MTQLRAVAPPVSVFCMRGLAMAVIYVGDGSLAPGQEARWYVWWRSGTYRGSRRASAAGDFGGLDLPFPPFRHKVSPQVH